MTEHVEKHPRLQAVMSGAYARWQANRSWSPTEFMAQCTAAEAAAVRIGNLNYQVENGGFGQYWGNNYATRETVAEVHKILAQILAHTRSIGGYVEPTRVVGELHVLFSQSIGNHYSPYGHYLDEQTEHRICERLNPLDHQFYAVNDEFMLAAEAWHEATYK